MWQKRKYNFFSLYFQYFSFFWKNQIIIWWWRCERIKRYAFRELLRCVSDSQISTFRFKLNVHLTSDTKLMVRNFPKKKKDLFEDKVYKTGSQSISPSMVISHKSSRLQTIHHMFCICHCQRMRFVSFSPVFFFFFFVLLKFIVRMITRNNHLLGVISVGYIYYYGALRVFGQRFPWPNWTISLEEKVLWRFRFLFL